MISEHDCTGGRLTIDLGAIAANWRHMTQLSAPAECAAVVKADAYGLGAGHVVPALAAAGCRTFCVALPQEGVEARRLAPDARIFVLNGLFPGALAQMRDHRLIPVLSSMDDVRQWAQAANGGPSALHVDTGMNRLGVRLDEALTLATDADLRRQLDLVHVMSHFACADVPGHAMNQRQIGSFQAVASAFADLETSLSNSAGTIGGGAHGCSMTRPGIALYGGEAVTGLPNPMRPAVTLEARIIRLQTVKAGETVSYGASHRLTRDTRIATASVGYADGYLRGGSGSGVPLRSAVVGALHGAAGGHRAPVLGRITMDMTCFDVTDVPAAALADGWIELIGPSVPLDEAARACGTIGYELLTSLGARHRRHYLAAGSA